MNINLISTSKYTLEWRMPKFPIPYGGDKILVLFVLEVINGLPTTYQFLKEWMIQKIWGFITPQADTIAYACTILLSRHSDHNIARQLMPVLFEEGHPLQQLENLIEAVNDPYARFMAINNMDVQDKSPGMHKLNMASFLKLIISMNGSLRWTICLTVII
ncbi:MAG: hypothetical protein IPL65_22580 [Lewinellaceae bacterium]|nr:hypothetical protein [Lewinellaceae bacterium]